MPRSAITGAAPEHVVSVTEMPDLLRRLAGEEVDLSTAPPPSDLMETETALAMMDAQAYDNLDRPGEPASFSCPDCSGTLAVIPDQNVLRFRCRVGHAWSAHSLVVQQTSAMESALWTALRSLEEKATLTRDMSSRATPRGHRRSAEMFAAQCHEALHAARLVRELMTLAITEMTALDQRTELEQA